MGVGGVAEEACFLEAEVGDAADDAVVVRFAAGVAAGGVGAVHAFAEAAVFGVAEEGDVGRGVEGE